MFELNHIFKTYITMTSFTYEKDQINSKTPADVFIPNKYDLHLNICAICFGIT